MQRTELLNAVRTADVGRGLQAVVVQEAEANAAAVIGKPIGEMRSATAWPGRPSPERTQASAAWKRRTYSKPLTLPSEAPVTLPAPSIAPK